MLRSQNTTARPQPLAEVLDFLDRMVREGLAHGFFEITIICSIGSARRRDVIIRSGKSHKFTIREEDLLR